MTTTDDQARMLRTLARLRDLSELPLTFGGLVNSGMQLQLTQFVGSIAGALRGAVLDPGRGLGGAVVTLRRPRLVNDYVGSAGISHDYDHIIRAEQLRGMVAVPVVVRRSVRGVLYGAVRNVSPLGDRAIQSVVEAARDLEQDLAVRDDLARRLQQLDDQAAAQPPGAAAPSRREREQLREAYAELRLLARDIDDSVLRERIEAVCEKLAPAPQSPRTEGPGEPALSARELDVLAAVALGRTNPQIADELGLTAETVKSYLRSATRKLHARSRLEAVVAARRCGLLP